MDYKFKEIKGKRHIFDIIRKKYILFTPEEWVRQNFIHLLISEKGYSKNLIKVESNLIYNKLQKRSDILVYNREGTPLLLVECKAEHIKIDQNVLEQVSRYNLIIKAPYFAVSNGKQTYCFKAATKDYPAQQMAELPNFENL